MPAILGVILGILRLIPGMARLLTFIGGWLVRRRWGQWVIFYLVTAAGAWIAKLISFAGILFVSNEFLAPQLIPFVSGPLLGMPDPFPQLLALTKIDKAATILLSAVAAKSIASIRIARNPSSPNWTTSPGAGP